jgi:hypothetical protein
MSNNYKVLGQSAPAATTDTTVYTVPANRSAVCSSITVCNRSATLVASFRIAVVPSGGGLGNSSYIFYDACLEERETLIKVMGITLAAGDTVHVYASTANLTFNLFGNEIA